MYQIIAVRPTYNCQLPLDSLFCSEALEVNCNAPMETSLQMHCDTPQCPRTEEPSKPVPAPHASENSSKCMDPANWMSPGKENLKPPANVLKSPRQSLAFGLFGSSKKEPSKHQVPLL